MNNRFRIPARKPVLFILFLVLCFVSIGIAWNKKLSLEVVRSFILGLGGFSYLAFFMACAFRSLLFLPCGIFSALGGMLFGPVLGTAVTVAGVTASSVFPFYMSRSMGRGWAERYFSKQLQSADRFLSKKGFYSVFMMRVIPVLPFDAVSCIGGMVSVRLKDFLAATFLGSIPGVFVYNYFGNSLYAASYKKIILSAGLVAAFALAPLLYKVIQVLLQKLRLKVIGSKCPN